MRGGKGDLGGCVDPRSGEAHAGILEDEIYKIPECIPFFCTVTGKKVDPNHSLACEIHVGTKKML